MLNQPHVTACLAHALLLGYCGISKPVRHSVASCHAANSAFVYEALVLALADTAAVFCSQAGAVQNIRAC